jgi:hypothetical protein
MRAIIIVSSGPEDCLRVNQARFARVLLSCMRAHASLA